ncbi:DUF2891 family protein [Flavobacteriaceae bacterium Ap0902]|nr:DUF2891 family protein [Flavobacteriaceae bacterium Ap0902]
MKLIWILLLLPILAWSQSTQLTKQEAKKLLELPLHCIETEFPNKLGQTLASAEELGTPKALHPAFYGCFDWHSSVHGYWTIVNILQQFPALDADDQIKSKLVENLSEANIQKEISYFLNEQEYSFERAYGWAWLFKLQESLNRWDTKEGEQLSQNLRPLTDLVSDRFMKYIEKLRYPIRVGTHTNTAFAMSLAYDYALTNKNTYLAEAITQRAKDFYINDKRCPLGWEPSGYDFLSPCMQELDLMRKVLPETSFMAWLGGFLPEVMHKDFDWEVGEVSDRNDGHMVHLDGLNFSRAWVFYDLAHAYPTFAYLIPLADKHLAYSYPNLMGDAYEGGHWLGTFALYTILKAKNK